MSIIRTSFALAALIGLAACQTTTGSVYGDRATSGTAHTEPVHFNGQRYNVTFKYQSSFSGYDVSVVRPARPLRDSGSDKTASMEVMTSSLAHFACANGQKAKVTPGSAAYAAGNAWTLKARCA